MSVDSDIDYSSDCECDDDYYNNDAEDVDVEMDTKTNDLETLIYECLNEEEVEKLLNESVESLSNEIKVTPSLAKILLSEHHWNNNIVIEKYRENATELLINARIKPSIAATRTTLHSGENILLSTAILSAAAAPTTKRSTSTHDLRSGSRLIICKVCITGQTPDKYYNLSCGHSYCKDCWTMHFETQIQLGLSIGIGCMSPNCEVRVPEDLLLALLHRPVMRNKYQRYAFHDYVKSHPELRFCPGANCQVIIRSKELIPKKACCNKCNTVFCFKCGTDYHAPTDCVVIKRWLTKCIDDSETANYITANTKDCPHCQIRIEKNGGCNHMQCFKCKHDFCWMCLGDWKTHGSEYYECSRYKENPNIAHESVHVQAREALRKYLHYYERWANHAKSLQLEQQTLSRMKTRINGKVMNGTGTWIDYQHLFNAASLLAKCRYTLQYTYPYAYFMDSGSHKNLFEYQQAQLEAEIENLSWKIERFETIYRGDLENQMDISEKRRTTLLKDFFPINANNSKSNSNNSSPNNKNDNNSNNINV